MAGKEEMLPYVTLHSHLPNPKHAWHVRFQYNELSRIPFSFVTRLEKVKRNRNHIRINHHAYNSLNILFYEDDLPSLRHVLCLFMKNYETLPDGYLMVRYSPPQRVFFKERGFLTPVKRKGRKKILIRDISKFITVRYDLVNGDVYKKILFKELLVRPDYRISYHIHTDDYQRLVVERFKEAGLFDDLKVVNLDSTIMKFQFVV